MTAWAYTYAGQTKRDLTVLGLLLALLIGLIFLYLFVTRPLHQADRPALQPGLHWVFSIYATRPGDDLRSPNAVAVDRKGDIYVADTANHRIAVFNGKGRFKFEVKKKKPGKGYAPGDLRSPLGVAVDSVGRIYVTSLQSGVHIFTPDGTEFKRLPIPSIQARAVGRRVFVTGPDGVVVLDREGEVAEIIGGKGRALGQFELPNDVAVAADGKLIVSDTQNTRLQIFDKDRRVTAYKGNTPSDMNDSDRLFGLNTGMDLDDAGRVYVADAFGQGIRMLSKGGDDLGLLGEQGSADGQFNYPSDVTYLGGDRFAVADKWNDRIQIVRLIPDELKGAAGRPAQTPAAPSSGRLWWVLAVALTAALAYGWRRKRASTDFVLRP